MDELTRDVRVLHIDDDGDFLNLTKHHLESEFGEFVVETATDAEAGLERLREDGIDCVVVDYKMPTMDGLELLEAIREIDDDLPVIFFTGRGSEEIASEAIKAGVTDYINKGTDERTVTLLGKRVRTHVGRQRAEAELAARNAEIREIYERVRAAFLAVDDEWRVTYLNGQAEHLLDCTEEAVLGERLWDAFPSVADTTFETELRRAMTEQEPVAFEVQYEPLDAWLEVYAYPASDGVSMFVEDVTEYRTALDDLEQLRADLEVSEGKFRTLRQKIARPPSPFRP